MGPGLRGFATCARRPKVGQLLVSTSNVIYDNLALENHLFLHGAWSGAATPYEECDISRLVGRNSSKRTHFTSELVKSVLTLPSSCDLDRNADRAYYWPEASKFSSHENRKRNKNSQRNLENPWSEKDILLIWRNRQAAVIGRHQNPFVECDVRWTQTNGVQLARRYSGGGAVYHDLGNVNVSFLTDNKRHCRKTNLTFLCDVLNRKFGIPAVQSPRDDIVVNDAKVSGTAARRRGKSAYHHLTLLSSVDRASVHSALNSPFLDLIQTTATRSTKSPVTSLDIDPDELVAVVASEWLSLYEEVSIHLVTPTLPADELRSWSWIFGKTPKFTVRSPFGTTIEVVNGMTPDGRPVDCDSLEKLLYG